MSTMPIQLENNESQISKVQCKATEYILNSKAPNTIRAYLSDWKHFRSWCESNGLVSLPATVETIGLYLTTFAEIHKVATLQRHLTAIREAHKAVDIDTGFMENATLKALWRGIKRVKGAKQTQKAPLLTKDILSLNFNTASLKGKRDLALILLGFAGAFRRSELVSLNVEDLVETERGFEVYLSKSKTDQESQGMLKAIPYGSHSEVCPVRTLKEWICQLGRSTGPLFVSIRKGDILTENRLPDKSVAAIVKIVAIQMGGNVDDFSGHSLRVGFVTQSAINGCSDRAIMNQSGHRSRAMVDKYVRRVTVWQDNASTRLGL